MSAPVGPAGRYVYTPPATIVQNDVRAIFLAAKQHQQEKNRNETAKRYCPLESRASLVAAGSGRSCRMRWWW
jgi:hypothetical protein